MIKLNCQSTKKDSFSRDCSLKVLWSKSCHSQFLACFGRVQKRFKWAVAWKQVFLVLWQFSFIITYKFYEVNYVKKSFFRLLWHALVCFGKVQKTFKTDNFCTFVQLHPFLVSRVQKQLWHALAYLLNFNYESYLVN